jgi:gamma-tubulin complex component 4
MKQILFFRYNAIFGLLFNIKRAQIELQKAWKPQKQSKGLPSNERASLMKTWLLRRNMAFLIDNLQYYFQVGILNVQYSQMISNIENSTEFDTIRKAHDEFLSRSYGECFLGLQVVIRCLDRIIQICVSFCSFLISREEEIEPTKLHSISEVIIAQKKFLTNFRNSKSNPLCY